MNADNVISGTFYNPAFHMVEQFLLPRNSSTTRRNEYQAFFSNVVLFHSNSSGINIRLTCGPVKIPPFTFVIESLGNINRICRKESACESRDLTNCTPYFDNFSFMWVECATGIEDNLLPLFNKTVFKLTEELSTNNHHSDCS